MANQTARRTGPVKLDYFLTTILTVVLTNLIVLGITLRIVSVVLAQEIHRIPYLCNFLLIVISLIFLSAVLVQAYQDHVITIDWETDQDIRMMLGEQDYLKIKQFYIVEEKNYSKILHLGMPCLDLVPTLCFFALEMMGNDHLDSHKSLAVVLFSIFGLFSLGWNIFKNLFEEVSAKKVFEEVERNLSDDELAKSSTSYVVNIELSSPFLKR